jgi:hypothetical protein
MVPEGEALALKQAQAEQDMLCRPPQDAPPPASPARKRSHRQRTTTPHSGATTPRGTVIFSGIPRPDGHEAVLFDSMRAAAATSLPEEGMFSRLRVLFPSGSPKADDVDPAISLLLFVDDLSAPRASVRLVDLVRQGGERPLHIAKRPGQVVRLVLADPAGAWAASAYLITVVLEWQKA